MPYSYYEVISCRLAIQVCIGHSPSGRARHRTFLMKGIRPDAPDEAIGAILRALAPLLVYRITKVRKVTKRTIFFVNNAVPAAPAAVAVLVEPEIVTLLAPADPIIPIWKAKEEEKFALVLFVMYIFWLRILSRLPLRSGGARIGFCMSRGSGRAPPWVGGFLRAEK